MTDDSNPRHLYAALLSNGAHIIPPPDEDPPNIDSIVTINRRRYRVIGHQPIPPNWRPIFYPRDPDPGEPADGQQ